MKQTFNTRMAEELRIAFDQARAVRGRLKVEEALEQAVAAWISGGAAAPSAESPLEVPGHLEPVLRKCADLLSRGKPSVIKALVSNIEVFHALGLSEEDQKEHPRRTGGRS